jgi:hypothetical protein
LIWLAKSNLLLNSGAKMKRRDFLKAGAQTPKQEQKSSQRQSVKTRTVSPQGVTPSFVKPPNSRAVPKSNKTNH